MSLTEKLKDKFLKKKVELSVQEKESKDTELAPVRDKIIKLKDLLFQLNLIKGSLELKKGDNIDGGVSGEGMKEYSDNTKEQTQKEAIKIDSQIEDIKKDLKETLNIKNEDQLKEVMKEMGIEDKDQLVENPEFSEDVEVISYKESKKQEELLKMSDQALQERLIMLGVNIEGDFSYDLAEKMIDEKLRSINAELSQEKLKTPEGKEEAIEIIANTLKESLPRSFFSVDEKKQEYKVSINLNNSYNKDITIKGSEASFKEWYNAELLPKNIKELEEKYGKEIVHSSIKKAYEDKIQKDIEDFDKQNENNYSLKQKLEKVSPEKGKEAQNAFKEYSNLQNEFRKTIKEKSDELKEKGIEFSSTSPRNYGTNYENLIQFGNDYDIKDIEKGLGNVYLFPPKFDYEKLQVAILKLSENLKGLINSIEDLKTEEDINSFLNGSGKHRGDSVISEFHRTMLENQIKAHKFNSSFTEEIETAKNNGSNDSPSQKLIDSGMKTFDQVENYLNQKISVLEGVKKIALEKINTAVEVKLKQKELEEEITVNNFTTRDVDLEFSKLEKNKKDALGLMSTLTRLEIDLPQEELVFSEGVIMIPSVEQEINELKKLNSQDEEKLKIIKQRNSSHENKAPKKVLGITTGEGKWKQEQTEKKEQSDLEAKIKEANDKIDQLNQKLNHSIITEEKSDIGKLIKEQKDIKGKPDEIFKELRIKLKELMDKKFPESVAKLSNEIKELESKLN